MEEKDEDYPSTSPAPVPFMGTNRSDPLTSNSMHEIQPSAAYYVPNNAHGILLNFFVF